jgi:transcriptional regulator with GAF, ATPase, and Fis domain
MSAGDDEDLGTSILSRPDRIDVPAVELAVASGPDAGKRVHLARDERPSTVAHVGVAPGNDLVLTDPTVSRMHCEVQVAESGVRILDAGSTNGTLVDGVRVRDADLRHDSLVGIGQTTIRVIIGPERLAVELSPRDRFGELLGASKAMRKLFAVLERVAPTDATLLIQGETGTGKELVARSVHEASKRADGAFVTVDCGAIAETLIESELFGHVKGAFSGASADREGLIAMADGGTLFLDEVGELPWALQPKLLRVLESREVRPVGSNSPQKVDVRVIAATHQPLARRVNERTFREDLFYRLAVVEVAVPPLRARRGDVPILAAHFLERFHGAPSALPRDVVDALLSRSWPGNVRELRNFVERTAALGFRPAAEAADPAGLPAELDGLVPLGLPLKEARVAWMEQFESVYVRAMLRRTGGNVSRAAELAGVNRRFLQRMLARLGIRSADEAPGRRGGGDGH